MILDLHGLLYATAAKAGRGPAVPGGGLCRGRAWTVREGDCYNLGRAEAVCAEMRRFLAGVEAGGDGDD
ncbi:MAG TPA: hypothetical protein VF759_13030 [Allosphingosinicella sp.]|jgi:hypothetical protein